MARIMFGTVLQVETATSGTYADILDFKSITLPESSVSDVDVTSGTQSTNVKQTEPGMVEGGTAEIECYFDTHTKYSQLNDLLGDKRNFRTKIDGYYYSWGGYINKVGGLGASGPDEPLMFKASMKVNTIVTVAAVPA